MAPRNDKNLYNKPEEGPKIMSPAHDFFATKIADDCTRERIAVDLFIALPEKQDIDLATLAPVCGRSGGELTFYQPWDITRHSEKLYYSLFKILTRPTVSEVAIKARCSTGLSITEYIGSHLSYKLADISVAQTDSDKTFTILMRNDSKLEES